MSSPVLYSTRHPCVALLLQTQRTIIALSLHYCRILIALFSHSERLHKTFSPHRFVKLYMHVRYSPEHTFGGTY